MRDYKYTLDHQTGSHQIWKFQENTTPITVPFHKELKPGTAKGILDDIAQDTNTTLISIKKDYNLKL